jgi:protein associated with RNAse G/E
VHQSPSFSLHSTKHDGSLHYAHPLLPVAQTPRLLVAYCDPGRPLRSHRGNRPTAHHSLHFYWASKPFNLCVMWLPDWSPLTLYVNIATPATWDDSVVRFVDLDLDVPWRASSPAPHVEDRDEFDLHRVTMNYSEDLAQTCLAAVDTVLELFAQRRKPFCPSTYDWRPGQTALTIDRPSLDAFEAIDLA